MNGFLKPLETYSIACICIRNLLCCHVDTAEIRLIIKMSKAVTVAFVMAQKFALNQHRLSKKKDYEEPKSNKKLFIRTHKHFPFF